MSFHHTDCLHAPDLELLIDRLHLRVERGIV